MSKTTLTYIVGGAIVLGVGIAGYMLMQPGMEFEVQENSVNTAREAGAGMATGKMSMKNLVAAGVSQKCTFNESNDISQSSGTVYIANGKMRGDFDSMAQGIAVKSHMIVDGEYSYVWTPDTNQGFKMSITAGESTGASGSSVTQGQQTVDYNQELAYSCEPWTADSSRFSLPSGVVFMDMSTMMRDAQSGLPTGR